MFVGYTGGGMNGTLVLIKISNSWVPLGTGNQENFRSCVLLGTGYQPDKKFWVPVGAGTDQISIYADPLFSY